MYREGETMTYGPTVVCWGGLMYVDVAFNLQPERYTGFKFVLNHSPSPTSIGVNVSDMNKGD